MTRLTTKAAIFALAALMAAPALAADDSTYTIVIKDHRFQPAEVTIPANTKVTLLVKNQDPTPEEFESHELNREKIIPGGTELRVVVGPLEPGTYRFVGEFHEDTAQGRLVVE